MKFSEIVNKLGTAAACNSLTANIDTDPTDPEITAVASIDVADTSNLSYIEDSNLAAQVTTTRASALILPQDEALQIQASERGIAWIAAVEPRLVLAQAIALFYKPFRPAPEIHPSAIIDASAELGQDVYIGAHAIVHAGVKIGDRVCIYPNVVIYPEVQIGDRTILHANCTIHERARIGADCVVHSGAVVGAEGFGFVPTQKGWYKMEQAGHTLLEDGIEVGCNSTIDRAAVGKTQVGHDTKLDNLVHIGHGCQVGSNCTFASQVGVAGSVTVGNQVHLAEQVGIANNAEIGDGAIATANAGIYGDVKPGAIVTGYPAIPHKVFLKAAEIFSRLPEIYQILKQLQRHSK